MDEARKLIELITAAETALRYYQFLASKGLKGPKGRIVFKRLEEALQAYQTKPE